MSTNLKNFSMDKLSNIDLDKLCEFCELHILGRCHNTIHYQCEGRHCDEAIEMFSETIEQIRLNSLNILLGDED